MDRPPRILLVEDEYMIAQDTADGLRALGAEVVGPLSSVSKAMAVVEQDCELDGAVLDINLQGQMVFPVADRLLARNVPIVFTSGYDENALPTRYTGVLLCQKPVTPQRLRSALSEALHRRV